MRAFLTRLGLGLGIGAALALGLYLALGGGPGPPPLRADPLVGGGLPGPPLAEIVPAGRPWLVYLAAGGHSLPPAVAPVVEIRPGGALRALRAAPVPETPTPDAASWLAAGLVLPVRRLADLSGVERAALLEVLRRWPGRGQDDAARIAPWGIDSDRGEVARLCRWAR